MTKLHVLIVACFNLWHIQDQPAPTLDPDSSEYKGFRTRILRCERILLHTMEFDLCVEHPYKFLIETVKSLQFSGMIQDSVKKDFAQQAVKFLNDSTRTSLCLQFSPQKIASATIYLAAAFLDFKVPPKQASKWDQSLGISDEELKSICQQILETYTLHINSDRRMEGLETRLIERGVISNGVESPWN